MDEQIRQVIAGNARLSVDMNDLGDDDDLYRCGMSSQAAVSVMLALEDLFEVEFTEELLVRSTFSSVSAMREALEKLGVSGS